MEERGGAPRDVRVQAGGKKKAKHFMTGFNSRIRFVASSRLDQVQEPQRLERKTVRLLPSRHIFYNFVEGTPCRGVCVVALTGLNEPLCVSSRVGIIYRSM